MRGDLSIRKVRTGSGAIAVQIIKYVNRKRVIVRHIGSVNTDDELKVMWQEAEIIREELCAQPSLFARIEKKPILHAEHLTLRFVTHQFAINFLRTCSQVCGLGFLDLLYQDLALMRIVEPASKLRTLELMNKYFNLSYARRTLYRLLPRLIEHKVNIEEASYQTACKHFGEAFALVLYDVTTLYFESHEPDDDLRSRGFSKDNKSQQPQIVVGLLVTPQGFPLRHEVYKGNTFEGHTMLEIVKQFQERHKDAKPIIVADAAMLSQENMESLEKEGYQYIVGARLSNTSSSFIDKITSNLTQKDGNNIRLPYPNRSYSVICAYSESRAKKEKRELDKQLARACELIARKELGKRAKFIKKSEGHKDILEINEVLKIKTERLLGIKGYVTNIPSEILSNEQVISCYHELWHVEQAFRMSKTDLKTRPIFHYTHDAIKAHVLLCFMALMVGKFLEIKTNLSLRRIRDILWDVQEAHIEDELTGRHMTLMGSLEEFNRSQLSKLDLSH